MRGFTKRKIKARLSDLGPRTWIEAALRLFRGLHHDLYPCAGQRCPCRFRPKGALARAAFGRTLHIPPGFVIRITPSSRSEAGSGGAIRKSNAHCPVPQGKIDSFQESEHGSRTREDYNGGDRFDCERPQGQRRRTARHAAALGRPGAARTHGHEIRLRLGPVRRLHGAVDGQAVRSCQDRVASVAGKKVTTIEGLSANGEHPLQKAWVAEQMPQCGYCQSGQIMQAAELLAKNPEAHARRDRPHMDGNLCRCGTYPRIVRAIERAAKEG